MVWGWVVPAWYLRDKFYRDAYELARWLADSKFRGVVIGMPGTGKTTRLMLSPLFLERPVVLSFPLRRIRDEFYGRVVRDPRLVRLFPITEKVRAHDEVCDALSKRIQRNPGEKYHKLLAEHFREVEKGNEVCYWKDEIKRAVALMRSNQPKLILTTHQVAFMLRLLGWVYRVGAVFVFDEGEDLFLRLGEPVNLAELEVVKFINKKVYYRIKSLFKKYFPNVKVGYLLLPLVRDVVLESVFVSATFPPTLLRVFEENIPNYPTYSLKMRRERDVIVLLEQELYWEHRKTWERVLYPQVLQVVGKSREKGYAVGVVCRNKTQCSTLTTLLEGLGYRAWADCRDSNPVDFYAADVVLITTLGKGYRGVNLYSKVNKNSNRWDFPVVIGFYQGSGIDESRLHPYFKLLVLHDNPFKKTGEDEKEEDRDEVGDFLQEMVYAKNFQSLFRFARDLTKKHLLVLLDKRWREVFRTYAPTHYEESPKVIVKDINDVAGKVSTVLDVL